MLYIDLHHLSSAEFKRLCGVSRNTFREMTEVLRPHLERQGRRGGQAKLSAVVFEQSICYGKFLYFVPYNRMDRQKNSA